MFFQILDEVTKETNLKCQGSDNFNDYLFCAIGIWCSNLDISQDETNYILRGYNQQEIRTFLYDLCQEGKTEKKPAKIPNPWSEQPTTFSLENQFYQHIKALFYRMNITIEYVKFIVIIAFVVTAVGYSIYRLNQLRQQQTSRREELGKSNSNPSCFTVQPPTVPAHLLVLVVSASQADFLESLKSKGLINVNDGEELYEMTKYLWLCAETDFSESVREACINQYSVSTGQESEYDIYLVSFELNQPDERFETNVNQLDRYDAFRNLAGLEINFISPRLQMKAYGNFEVYTR